MTLTTTTTTNKMPTTTVNALKSVNAQKWSESDVEPNYEELFNYEESSDVEPEYPEYEESSANFEFGACCECDVMLCDKSEFVCRGRANTCNACYNYHINLHIGGEHGGCN